MKILSVTWDCERDETVVNFDGKFITSDWVTQMDVVKDVIAILEHEYSKMLGTGFQSNLPAKSSADLL